MSNKKRNKVYKGSNAASVRPTIVKVSAVKRHPVHQWWTDHKRIAKPAMIAAGVVAAIIIVVIGIIGIIW